MDLMLKHASRIAALFGGVAIVGAVVIVLVSNPLLGLDQTPFTRLLTRLALVGIPLLVAGFLIRYGLRKG